MRGGLQSRPSKKPDEETKKAHRRVGAASQCPRPARSAPTLDQRETRALPANRRVNHEKRLSADLGGPRGLVRDLVFKVPCSPPPSGSPAPHPGCPGPEIGCSTPHLTSAAPVFRRAAHGIRSAAWDIWSPAPEIQGSVPHREGAPTVPRRPASRIRCGRPGSKVDRRILEVRIRRCPLERRPPGSRKPERGMDQGAPGIRR
jgi:hypothetical protein